MVFRRSTAVFAMIVGALMAVMWIFFLAAGMVPELAEKPAEIALHLAAEFLTAVVLIAGGVLMLKRKPAGAALAPVALGMLLYTLIVSPGYYIRSGETAFVVMFAVILIAAIAVVVLHMRDIVRALRNKSAATEAKSVK